MKTLAIIPARGGSSRIPRKNCRLFHGRPIIEYSIELALTYGFFDDVIVSTDDDEIGRIALKANASVFWRQPDDGTRGTQEVAKEVLLTRECSICCVLYPTCPLLDWEDLWDGYQRLFKKGVMYSYSVDGVTDVDIGGFYWCVASAVKAGIPMNNEGPYYKIPRYTELVRIDPRRAIDINTELDWSRAEETYARLQRARK